MRLLIITVHVDSGLVKMENYSEIMSRHHVAKSYREIILRKNIAKKYCGTIAVAFIKAYSLMECKLQISSKLPADNARLLVANDK